jgi:hypothetical protein
MAMAYDPIRRQTVLFGGSPVGNGTDETWLWNGSAWAPVANLNPRPAARTSARMVYHPRRQTLVMFGGTNGTTTFNDTWEWDGTSWALLTTDMPPPSRSARRGASSTARDSEGGRHR